MFFLKQNTVYFNSFVMSAHILFAKANHTDGQTQIKRLGIILCLPWGQNKSQSQAEHHGLKKYMHPRKWGVGEGSEYLLNNNLIWTIISKWRKHIYLLDSGTLHILNPARQTPFLKVPRMSWKVGFSMAHTLSQ